MVRGLSGRLLALTASFIVPLAAMQAEARNIDGELRYVMDAAITSDNPEIVAKMLLNTTAYYSGKTVDVALYTKEKMPARRDAIADVVMNSAAKNRALLLAALYSAQQAALGAAKSPGALPQAAGSPKKDTLRAPAGINTVKADSYRVSEVAAAEALNSFAVTRHEAPRMDMHQLAMLRQALRSETNPNNPLMNISYSWGANTSVRGPDAVSDVKFTGALVKETSPN